VQRARPADLVDMLDLTVADLRPEPGDIASRSDEVSRVTAAVAELPEEQRRAVVLASMYGRTAQEVSELEDIPLGTAKTRIRTGLIRLREALGASVAVDER
jgi:RNA polymerase sigma-70 factor (ECF subfamily)